jgi:hypothetical protein
LDTASPSPEAAHLDPDQDVVREEIAREQVRVDAAYESLERARTTAQAGVERAIRMPVSTPQSQFEREAELHRTMRRLKVISTSERQLVFGRLDLEDGSDPVYVGRVGLSDERRNRILVDWRAPVGSTFYRATARDPRGVVRRRTLVTKGREVTELNDDLLIPEKAKNFRVVIGEGALLRSLQRVRGEYMQDILATIQGEQDEIIRANPKANVVLTGGPGTGKSVVALHRTAYLMFERAEELERRGVLFVGPTARFSRYISRVLPSLGETSVQIRSVFNLTEPRAATAREPFEVARLKGRPEIAALVRKLLIDSYPPASEAFRLRTGQHELDLSAAEVADLRDRALRQGEGMNRARTRLVRALARKLPTEGGRLSGDQLKELANELAEETQVTDLLEGVLPIREADEAWNDIRADHEAVKRAARRVFTAAEARLLADDLAEPETRVGDLPLIDEVRWLLGDPPDAPAESDETEDSFGGLFSFQDQLDGSRQSRMASSKRAGFGHVVVDEAQDLTPMQWRTLGRLGPYATWNVVGDPNQATLATPEELEASIAALPGFGRETRFELAINYRTPAEIMRRASELSGIDLGGLRSIRESGREPEAFGSLAEALASLADEPGSTVVIAMDEPDAAAAAGEAGETEVLTALDAKGLEFDNVVLYNPGRLLPVTSRADASLLLIAATRTTRNLAIVEPG